jgi:hypothetical protein
MEKPIQPDEIDGFDFANMLNRNVPMIEIVSCGRSSDSEKTINTISISGYNRIASCRNYFGSLLLLFEKVIEKEVDDDGDRSSVNVKDNGIQKEII